MVCKHSTLVVILLHCFLLAHSASSSKPFLQIPLDWDTPFSIGLGPSMYSVWGDMTAFPDRFGNPKGAVLFNQSHINFGFNNNSLSFPTLDSNRTVSLWMRIFNDQPANAQLVRWGPTCGASSRNMFKIQSISNTNNFGVTFCGTAVTSGFYMADAQWHHAAITVFTPFNQTTSNVSTYIDGVLWKSASVANLNTSFSSSATLGGGDFVGVLDDVRIFDFALSPLEIWAVYRANDSYFGTIWESTYTPQLTSFHPNSPFRISLTLTGPTSATANSVYTCELNSAAGGAGLVLTAGRVSRKGKFVFCSDWRGTLYRPRVDWTLVVKENGLPLKPPSSLDSTFQSLPVVTQISRVE